MSAIEKVVIGVVSALISSSLLFVETAAYKPEVENPALGMEQLANQVTASQQVASLQPLARS